jgi:hypothetical protein
MRSAAESRAVAVLMKLLSTSARGAELTGRPPGSSRKTIAKATKETLKSVSAN